MAGNKEGEKKQKQISAKYHASDSGEYEPGSHGRVLKNLLGLTKKTAMDAEEVKGYAKALRFVIENITLDQQLTVTDINAIHKLFFSDLYSWAGKPREVNLTKEGFTFPSAQFLEQTLNTFEQEILKPNTPCFCTQEQVLKKIAQVHLELLFIHPYREGNGRTARIIATILAMQAGYKGFNWNVLEERFDDYIRSIQKLNGELMATLLRDALVQ